MVKLTPTERDILDGLTDFGLHPISLAEARDRLRPFREEQGFNPDTLPVLLTAPESSYKLDKSITPTWSLSLAQHRLAGFNVCPSSTPQCRRVCVADSGKGNLSSVKRGRIWRTRALRPCRFLHGTSLRNPESTPQGGRYGPSSQRFLGCPVGDRCTVPVRHSAGRDPSVRLHKDPGTSRSGTVPPDFVGD